MRFTQAAALGILAVLISLSLNVVRPPAFRVQEGVRAPPEPSQSVAVARRAPTKLALPPPTAAPAAPVMAVGTADARPAPTALVSIGVSPSMPVGDRPAVSAPPSDGPAPPAAPPLRLRGRFGWALERAACPPPGLLNAQSGLPPSDADDRGASRSQDQDQACRPRR